MLLRGEIISSTVLKIRIISDNIQTGLKIMLEDTSCRYRHREENNRVGMDAARSSIQIERPYRDHGFTSGIEELPGRQLKALRRGRPSKNQ